MEIELDPQIAAIFKASTAVSGKDEALQPSYQTNTFIFFLSQQGGLKPSDEGGRKKEALEKIDRFREGT